MLLFIIYFYFLLILYQHFKTSHVIVYRWNTLLMFVQVYYFKTSHVIVYPWTLQLARYGRISKHLMLLFIRKGVNAISIVWGFQNISCYCLSLSHSSRSNSAGISKHLMLLFIVGMWCKWTIYHYYFKTSHVIVYQKLATTLFFFRLDFKTSHVIVYQSWPKGSRQQLKHFKTSHVIVYRFPKNGTWKRNTISKHLMLLFISFQPYQNSVDWNFKTSHVIVYPLNQCRGLSGLQYFKTSHVIVYQIFHHDNKLFQLFQNISCYCLSD